MLDNKITVNKIVLIIAYTLLVCLCLFSITPFDSTNSYLASTGSFVGKIEVAGLEYKVYQKTTGDYEDVTSTGIILGTRPFSTDTTYTYDVILKNDDPSTSTAAGFYVRWKFVATIDGVEQNINFAIKTDITANQTQTNPYGKNSHLSGDYFYYVTTGSTLATLDAQETVSLLSSVEFVGSYNSQTDSYGSLLDSVFAGSTFEFKLVIEGSSTAFY